MSDIVTDRYVIKYISHQLKQKLTCPSNCVYCDRPDDCSYIQKLKTSNQKNIVYNIVRVLIRNNSENELTFSPSCFRIIDTLGFSYEPISFCNNYFADKRVQKSSVDLPSYSQVYMYLVFPEMEKGALIHNILEYDGFNKEYNHITIDEYTAKSYEDSLLDEISELKSKLSTLEKEKKDLESKAANTSTSRSTDDLIKYRTEDDDDYLYIISNEKEYTISFNREFDKSKDNYNWINIDDPLITMRLDNVFSYMNCPTKINSPVSGVFEFDKNKLIKYNEIICKIKKYPIEQKDIVISKFERKAIKDAIYKKEIKKMIERQTLDELIDEGLIFNFYIDKFGNRSKISSDLANAVWNRDGGKCIYCGSKESLEFDHIIPFSKGGATTYRNLQLLCEKCNREKSDKI